MGALEQESIQEGLGVEPGPGFSLEAQRLDEGLGALETDKVVRSRFSSELWDCYSSVKRNEIDLLERAEPGEACERYLQVY
jgi:glutamine synthetase